jgi:hypothetical protein
MDFLDINHSAFHGRGTPVIVDSLGTYFSSGLNTSDDDTGLGRLVPETEASFGVAVFPAEVEGTPCEALTLL